MTFTFEQQKQNKTDNTLTYAELEDIYVRLYTSMYDDDPFHANNTLFSLHAGTEDELKQHIKEFIQWLIEKDFAKDIAEIAATAEIDINTLQFAA